MTSRRAITVLTAGSALITYTVLRARERWYRAQRVSNAVRNWWPGRGERVQFGPVDVRATTGTAEDTTILLHGLGTASDYWGGAWDRCAQDGNTLLVPDLYGFGRSSARKHKPDEFEIDDHVDALDDMVARAHGRLTIAGHSMGCIVALALAARHADRVDRVVLFGPPLHDSAAEAHRFILTRGWFARYFAIDRWTSRFAWTVVCRFPQVARRCGKLIAPWMPTPVAERVAGHSWNSYVGTLRAMMHAPGWRPALKELRSHHVDVTIVVGNRDRTIDRELIDKLRGVHVEVIEHPDAGHQLPIMDPEWCTDIVVGAVPREPLRTKRPTAYV